MHLIDNIGLWPHSRRSDVRISRSLTNSGQPRYAGQNAHRGTENHRDRKTFVCAEFLAPLALPAEEHAVSAS